MSLSHPLIRLKYQLLGLGLLIVFGLILLSLPLSTATRLHFSDLMATPMPFPQPAIISKTDLVSVSFQDMSASTPSASLMRALAPDEALFLPVLQSHSLLANSQTTWDEDKVRRWIASISAQINTGAIPPSVTYTNGNLTIFPGKAGVGLDEAQTIREIMRQTQSSFSITGREITVQPPLDEALIAAAEKRAQRLLSLTPITFTAQDQKLIISPTLMSQLISVPEGFSQEAVGNLTKNWAKSFDIDTVEPELAFDGSKISTFRAPVEGRRLDVAKVNTQVLELLQSLDKGEEPPVSPISLAVITMPPNITLQSLNSLGITERIGRGDSDYFHSIPNRVFNVSLATSRIHGIIVMPGQTFSFNQTLGDVSAATGFKQAYVIDQGQTVLGDGGGVCQVSSTFFRALLDAGLPILERRGHSYRVGYYEQNNKPGFDATVSGPHPDLTFLNDTGSPILINAQADSKKLHMYVELYGKKDGRRAQILSYKQWDQSPAPPTQYQDDPTLPAGTLKQIDFAAGGLKTSFEYKVTYPNGEIKDSTYLTTYVPWRAVYLRGTKI